MLFLLTASARRLTVEPGCTVRMYSSAVTLIALPSSPAPTRGLTREAPYRGLFIPFVVCLLRRRVSHAETQPGAALARVHADRVAGGDRHHRHPDRPAGAGGAEGPRGGAAHPVQQQP